jgi:hypothetical protein
MTTLLSTIGRSLLISCMIPAIVFVTVTMVIFVPLLPTDLLTRLNVIESPPSQISPIPTPAPHTPPAQTSAVPTPLVQVSPIATPMEQEPVTERLVDFGSVLAIILVVSFLLAYFLMIMNWAVVRLYEGYYWVPFRDRFIQKQEQKQTALARDVAAQRRKLQVPSLDPELYQREWRSYVEVQDRLTSQFSVIASDILPFRLGNIHRAFEDYSFNCYNMDGRFFWPRLSEVIPDSYAAKIEEQNNALAFLLNSSLISVLISLEMLVLPFVSPTGAGELGWCIGIALLCGLLFYVFYHGATSIAVTYGHYIRTCFDLFRLDLLKELHIDPPTELGGEEEKALWRSVHEFLILGQDSPYQRKAPDTSPSQLAYTAAQLVQTWGALLFWNGLRRGLEWITTPRSPAARTSAGYPPSP